MRRILMVVLFLAGCSGTPNPLVSEVLSGSGTVRYSSLEGGFWELETARGVHYEAFGLPAELRVEGKRVFYVGTIPRDLVTAHMVPAIELSRVEAISD